MVETFVPWLFLADKPWLPAILFYRSVCFGAAQSKYEEIQRDQHEGSQKNESAVRESTQTVRVYGGFAVFFGTIIVTRGLSP